MSGRRSRSCRAAGRPADGAGPATAAPPGRERAQRGSPHFESPLQRPCAVLLVGAQQVGGLRMGREAPHRPLHCARRWRAAAPCRRGAPEPTSWSKFLKENAMS